jgi:hypothetical protein
MIEFNIPFHGFYESAHDVIMDDAVNQICENRDNGEVNQDLSYYLNDNVNWKAAEIEYSKEYTVNFASEYNIKGLQFVELDSPREYNFTTDRIFARCSNAEFNRMLQLVKGAKLDKVCRENLTSRDGFSSLYNPNFKTWGNWKTWDANQCSQVIEAYALEMGYTSDSATQWALMENDISNSVIYSIIETNCKAGIIERVYKIADYLTIRSQR